MKAVLSMLCVLGCQTSVLAQGGLVQATYSPALNQVTIEGTPFADQITVKVSIVGVKVYATDHVFPWEWNCAPRVKIVAHLYDGNDTISIQDPVPGNFFPTTELYGGPGEDFIFGSDGVDWIDGGPEHDLIWGRGSDDVIVGGPGPDDIWSGGGADFCTGSGGWFVGDGEVNSLDQGGLPDVSTVYFTWITNPEE